MLVTLFIDVNLGILALIICMPLSLRGVLEHPPWIRHWNYEATSQVARVGFPPKKLEKFWERKKKVKRVQRNSNLLLSVPRTMQVLLPRALTTLPPLLAIVFGRFYRPYLYNTTPRTWRPLEKTLETNPANHLQPCPLWISRSTVFSW